MTRKQRTKALVKRAVTHEIKVVRAECLKGRKDLDLEKVDGMLYMLEKKLRNAVTFAVDEAQEDPAPKSS